MKKILLPIFKVLYYIMTCISFAAIAFIWFLGYAIVFIIYLIWNFKILKFNDYMEYFKH